MNIAEIRKMLLVFVCPYMQSFLSRAVVLDRGSPKKEE